MQCPICESKNLKIYDSRDVISQNQTRRRRKCEDCGYRFSTREIVDTSIMRIIKEDKSTEQFNFELLKSSIFEAYNFKERDYKKADSIAKYITDKIMSLDTDKIKTSQIEDLVLNAIKDDEIAFVRYAVKHKKLNTIKEIFLLKERQK